MFFDLNLDMLIIARLAGGLSRFNSAELLWGYINKLFAGLMFGQDFVKCFTNPNF
jgi:hypothetical protein